jgi:hypothetical protein
METASPQSLHPHLIENLIVLSETSGESRRVSILPAIAAKNATPCNDRFNRCTTHHWKKRWAKKLQNLRHLRRTPPCEDCPRF